MYDGGDSELKTRIDKLDDSKNKHFIRKVDSGQGESNKPYKHDGYSDEGGYNASIGIPTGSITEYNPDQPNTENGNVINPKAVLAHELLGHGYANDQGTNTDRTSKTSYGIEKSEVLAVQIENRANKVLGLKERTTYGGKNIPIKDRQLPKTKK